MTKEELLVKIQQAKTERWTRLNLSGEGITELPPEIGQLTALQYLNLPHNKLSSLPFEIGCLRFLQQLNLNGNQLSRLPPEIGQLQNLRELSLSHNQLICLPPEIGQLSSLQWFDLSHNQLSSRLATEINLLKNLLVLDVRNNLSPAPESVAKLKKQGKGFYIPQNGHNLPEEFLEKESWEIYNYLTLGKGKLVPMNEAKVIFIGDGSVGKTCLVNRLLYEKFKKSDKTEGIDRHPWEGLLINEYFVRLNVWDFAGQGALHTTHQFFFTKRSVYVLVLDARRGEQESRLEYWLKLIQSFGGDSPILIAINKSTEEHRSSLNQRFLKEKYPSIKGFYPTDCKDNVGIVELKKKLKEAVAELPHIHALMPASWFELKQNLERCSENYISYKDYQALCVEHEITEPGNQDTLCGFLHDLGIVLNFREDLRLSDTNVLNPEWVTNGVYKLLNNLELFKNHGVFKVRELAKWLDKTAYPTKKEHQFIIDMMHKFELCLPLLERERYLIPELLQNEEPDLNWDKENSLQFEYHYDILPNSVFSRFIVRLHTYISKQTYWRTGVVLTYENNKALVKADLEDRKIFVWVTGTQATRRNLLAIIRQHFNHIHKTIKGLETKECVSLPQNPKIVIPYENLLKLEERGHTKYYYPEIDADIDVSELLAGVDTKQKLPATGMYVENLTINAGNTQIANSIKNEDKNMDIKIKKIDNYGHQQFADSIINQYANAKFEQNDIELLKFIAEVKTEKTTKQAIGKDVAVANDSTATVEEQENARSHISQFLLDHKSDVTAWAGRITKVAVGAILAQYGLSLADVGL